VAGRTNKPIRRWLVMDKFFLTLIAVAVAALIAMFVLVAFAL
jgi:hypothetical protein